MRNRPKTAWAVVVSLLLLAVLVGCRGEPAKEGGGPAAPRPVKILAYVNVSSGCQEPTIELLKSFKAEYPGRVDLGIVDFGDQGEGSKQWKGSGYDCMVIEVDGSPLVKFETGGRTKTVALRQPVGFWWTHDDLKAAVAAAIEGELQSGTEEEAIAGQPPRKIKTRIVTEQVKRDGKTFARVLINERSAMLIRASSGDQSPNERAEAAGQVLRKWLRQPVKPNEIDRKQVAGGWAVRVSGKVVAVATLTGAKAAGGTPDQLAKKWLVGIRQGIAIAARPEGTRDAAEKAPAPDEGCEVGG